jgi:hypothetical protein
MTVLSRTAAVMFHTKLPENSALAKNNDFNQSNFK